MENIRDFKVNYNDGRKREKQGHQKKDNPHQNNIDKLVSTPIEEKVEVTRVIDKSPPDFEKIEIVTEKSQVFVPTKAPPLPTNNQYPMSNVNTREKALQLDGSLKNVESISRMSDGKVYVTRVYDNYEQALETIEAIKRRPPVQPEPKPEVKSSCETCGGGLMRQGYTMVCPFCYYEKNR